MSRKPNHRQHMALRAAVNTPGATWKSVSEDFDTNEMAIKRAIDCKICADWSVEQLCSWERGHAAYERATSNVSVSKVSVSPPVRKDPLDIINEIRGGHLTTTYTLTQSEFEHCPEWVQVRVLRRLRKSKD